DRGPVPAEGGAGVWSAVALQGHGLVVRRKTQLAGPRREDRAGSTAGLGLAAARRRAAVGSATRSDARLPPRAVAGGKHAAESARQSPRHPNRRAPLPPARTALGSQDHQLGVLSGAGPRV